MPNIGGFLETCISFASSLPILVTKVFDASSFVGGIFVHTIVWFVETILDAVLNLYLFFGILCDDYSIFLSDLWMGIQTIGSSLKTAVVILTTSAGNILLSILTVIKTVLIQIINGTLNIYDIIAQIFIFIYALISLTYNSVAYVGLSIVIFVKDLPANLKLGVLFLAEAIFSGLKSILLSISLVKESITCAIYDASQIAINWLYESTYSFVGFLIGLIVCVLFFVNLRSIILFVMATVLTAFDGICLLISNCWSGEFFYYRPNQHFRAPSIELQRTENPQEEIQSVNEEREDSLCVVCLTNPKNMLFLPCRHVYVCQECSVRLHPFCPVCRVRIRRKIQVYL